MTTIVVPKEDPHRMTFIRMNRQQDLVAHIDITPHTDVGIVVASKFQLGEVNLGKPTKDMARTLTTLDRSRCLKSRIRERKKYKF